MLWIPTYLQSGQLVAFPTTAGDFKDAHILTASSPDAWMLVSLLDGLQSPVMQSEDMRYHLNEHHAVPIQKVVYGHTMPTLPENRISLPVVTLGGMRSTR